MRQGRPREWCTAGGPVLGTPTKEKAPPVAPAAGRELSVLASVLGQPGFRDSGPVHSSFPLLFRGVHLEKMKTPRFQFYLTEEQTKRPTAIMATASQPERGCVPRTYVRRAFAPRGNPARSAVTGPGEAEAHTSCALSPRPPGSLAPPAAPSRPPTPRPAWGSPAAPTCHAPPALQGTFYQTHESLTSLTPLCLLPPSPLHPSDLFLSSHLALPRSLHLAHQPPDASSPRGPHLK